MPHVDVPDKHVGVALGEATTLRTATKEHLEHRTQDRTPEIGNVRRWHSNKGRGEREGGVFLRSQDVGASGACRDRAPPGTDMSTLCPTWRFLAVDVGCWGTWWEMPKGTRETMTGAHLGGRGAGAGRRRTTPLQRDRRTRVVGGRLGHGDGRHHVDLWRTLFGTFWQRTRDVKNRGTFVLMDQTERF